MIEHAIHYQAHSQLVGMFDQILPILLRAKVWVDFVVILGIVGVVGGRVEDGVEVDRIDTQRLQIIQILIHTLEITTHVIAPARLLFVWTRGWWRIIKAPWTVGIAIRVITAIAFRQSTPWKRQHRVIVAHITSIGVIIPSSITEAIGEDLIDHRIIRPGRDRKSWYMDHQGVAVVDWVVSGAAQAAIEGGGIIGIISILGAIGNNKPIPQIIWLSIGQCSCPIITGRIFQVRLVAGYICSNTRHADQTLSAGVDAVHAQSDAVDIIVEGAESKRHRRARRSRAAWRAIQKIS